MLSEDTRREKKKIVEVIKTEKFPKLRTDAKTYPGNSENTKQNKKQQIYALVYPIETAEK